MDDLTDDFPDLMNRISAPPMTIKRMILYLGNTKGTHEMRR